MILTFQGLLTHGKVRSQQTTERARRRSDTSGMMHEMSLDLSGPGSGPGRSQFSVFLEKKLCSHSSILHPRVTIYGYWRVEKAP